MESEISEAGAPTRIEPVPAPACLRTTVQAFSVVRDGLRSYVLRDQVTRRSHDCELWQWCAMEALPECTTYTQMMALLGARAGKSLTRKTIELYFSDLAESDLLKKVAYDHPLLAHCRDAAPAIVDDTKAQFFPSLRTLAATGKAPDGAPTTSLRSVPATVLEHFSYDPDTDTPNSWKMFDPRPFLDRIVPWLRPLHGVVYLLPLLMLAALLTVSYHSIDFVHDMRTLYNSVSLLEHMAFSLVTTDLFSQTILGATAHYYGAAVNEWTTTIYFGFLPRFRVRVSLANKLPPRQQAWIYLSPILSRFFLQALGIMMWYHARSASPSQANIGLGMFMIATVDLIFASGNPFAKGSGYKLLTVILKAPNLRGNAFTALLNMLTGKPSPGISSKALTVYAGAVIAYMFILIYFVLTMVYNGLVNMSTGNVAVLLTFAIGVYLLRGQLRRVGRIGDAYTHAQIYDQWRGRVLPALPGNINTVKPAAPHNAGWYARRTFALTFLVVLILPYPYEAGGNLIIYPLHQSQITTDVPGVVDAVYFDGGEWVKKGTVIATLKHDDNAAKVQTYTGEMQAQQEVIDNLKTLPKPEEVKVAQSNLDLAISREVYSREKVPRFEALFERAAVSRDQLNIVRREHDMDVNQVLQRKAALALVKAGPTKDEIAAAEAKWQALKETRDGYQKKVDRAVLAMPFDGRIMTLHLKDKLNEYLDTGEVLADVEDDSSMTAEVDVPEVDISRVEQGKSIRARPYAFVHQDFMGTVSAIDSSVVQNPLGNYIKVVGVMKNEDGKLRAGMIGYAKIHGVYMPIWKAFTTLVLRYFNIEVWSWIP